MGPRVKQTQFLILLTLISAALCHTHREPIASESALKSFPENGDAKPALKFVYTVEDPETKIPCTMANMSISIALNYTTNQETVVRKQLKIPSKAVVNGTCKPMVSEMSLVWESQEHDKLHQNVVKFVLFNDRTNFSVFSVDVDLFLDSTNFPDATDKRRTTRSKIDLGLFDAPAKDGLHNCPMERRIKVDNDTTLIASKVSLIAFNTKKDYGQRKEIICDDNTNTKVFPAVYVEKRLRDVALLARMTLSVDIPYMTINNTIAKYTVENLTKHGMLFGHIYRNPTDYMLSGYLSLYYMTNELLPFVHINIYFTQDIDGDDYVTGVDLTYYIPKKYLPDAKYDPYREVKKRLLLFSAPFNSAIFSCPQVTTLYLDDVRLRISDVLLVMFDKKRDFSSKQVIDCNAQPKLTVNDFNYAVKEENGAVPCILANMSISMRIPYLKKGSTSLDDDYTYITVPNNAKASGSCGRSLSKMELTWPAEDSQTNSMAFYLSRDSSFSMFHLVMNIYKDNTSFPNIRDLNVGQWERYASNFSLGMFVGPENNGWYNCPERQDIIRNGKMAITISNVSLIAFNDQEDLGIKESYGCWKDEGKEPATIEPDPYETAFDYVVKDKNQKFGCILANMTISVKVKYNTMSNSEKETTFVVPKEEVTVSGNCNCRNPQLILSWQPKGTTVDPKQPYKTENSITLTFVGDLLSFRLNTIMVDFYMDKENFPHASGDRHRATGTNLDLFSSYIGSIHKCDLESNVEFRNVQMTFNDIAVTAYRNGYDLWTSKCFVPPSTADVSIGVILGAIFGGLLIGSLLGGLIYVCTRRYRRY